LFKFTDWLLHGDALEDGLREGWVEVEVAKEYAYGNQRGFGKDED
jgi:hypothetical protein